MRRYQAECEEETDIGLISRGCGDPHKQSPPPTSRVHLPPAHRHCNYRPADHKLKQVFSILYFKVRATATRQEGWDPHADGAEEQKRVCCRGCTLGFSPGDQAGRSRQERTKRWCTLMPVLRWDWGVHTPTCRSSGALWVHRLRHSLRERRWLTGATHSIKLSLEFSVGPK